LEGSALPRAGATPAEIKNKILGALAEFNRSNWHDDVTLLILAVS